MLSLKRQKSLIPFRLRSLYVFTLLRYTKCDFENKNDKFNKMLLIWCMRYLYYRGKQISGFGAVTIISTFPGTTSF